jgi:hypothetical protein
VLVLVSPCSEQYLDGVLLVVVVVVVVATVICYYYYTRKGEKGGEIYLKEWPAKVFKIEYIII